MLRAHPLCVKQDILGLGLRDGQVWIPAFKELTGREQNVKETNQNNEANTAM